MTINNFIESGYVPVGGVSILDQHAGFIYIQAMILQDK